MSSIALLLLSDSCISEHQPAFEGRGNARVVLQQLRLQCGLRVRALWRRRRCPWQQRRQRVDHLPMLPMLPESAILLVWTARRRMFIKT